MTFNSITAVPRWDLRSLYPSFEDPAFTGDLAALKGRLEHSGILLDGGGAFSGGSLLELIKTLEAAADTAEQLSAYAEAIYTTDTRDGAVLARISEIDAAKLPLAKLLARFREKIGGQKESVARLIDEDERIAPYRFFLQNTLVEAEYQLSSEMEDLAADLARSAADAWSRLHAALSSTASAVWDEKTGERKTVIALRSLAHDAARAVRARAYHAELAAWKSVETPLAAALCGVKGQAVTLDTRRGWQDPLAKSCFQSHMTQASLEALIGALEEALPLFRAYLGKKARLLGIEQCSFYDLFAPLPVPRAAESWSWERAAAFIEARFAAFDPEMARFARAVFEKSWIDALQREGKVGGAYCVDFPLAGQSRILCNFEGSFDSITTLAHEIGHAWHAEQCRGLPRFQTIQPMTLAETASIFAETIVFEGALQEAAAENSAYRAALIEGSVKDACQVCVDILSRFYFEKELFARRSRAELSPAELCEMTLDAQRKTYGGGLNGAELHPYMWAVKPHYYNYAFSFYNYPYAFGQFFASALWARAAAEGPAFAGVYRALLRETGRRSVEESAALAGFDLTQKEFWRHGIDLIAERIKMLS